MSNSPAIPKVSIILPTYNRLGFLEEAIRSITSQEFQDWELIVVDDGSTDSTEDYLAQRLKSLVQPWQYIYQNNQGAYAARNTGLELATGKYVAFYDSDDLWLPHHLQDCVKALEKTPEVDWVYGACRVIDHATGKEIEPSTFYDDSGPRPFMKLKSRVAGRLFIIDDPRAVHCQIMHGLFCGLQNSVLRKNMFDQQKIPAFRVGEDQLLTINCLISGFRFAYFDDVHVVYRVHSQSTSGGKLSEAGNSERAIHSVAEAHTTLLNRKDISGSLHRTVRRRLQEEYFWKLGYALFWMTGRRTEALQMFRRGLRLWPWSWRCWKTYFLALGRVEASRLSQTIDNMVRKHY